MNRDVLLERALFVRSFQEQLRDAQGHRPRLVAVQPAGGKTEAQGGAGSDLCRVERGAHGRRERVSGRGDVQLCAFHHARRSSGKGEK